MYFRLFLLSINLQKWISSIILPTYLICFKFDSFGHIRKYIVFEVNLVIFEKDQALFLVIKDFLVELSSPVFLNHFRKAHLLVQIDDV